MKFVKFMSRAHLANKNIALYEAEDGGALLALENVLTDEVTRSIEFASVENAEAWWDKIDGKGIEKLNNAIDFLLFQI